MKRVKENCFNSDRVQILPLDFANPDEIEKKVRTFMGSHNKNIDILLNNAGISMRAEFLDYHFENHKIMMNINYLS